MISPEIPPRMDPKSIAFDFADVALAAQILGKDDGLSQVTHGTAKPPAFVAKPEIRFFYGKVVLVLEDALGPLHQLASLELAFHLERLLQQAGVLYSQPGFGDGSAHLFADEREQRDLFRRVLVGLAMVYVDDADDIAAANQ